MRCAAGVRVSPSPPIARAGRARSPSLAPSRLEERGRLARRRALLAVEGAQLLEHLVVRARAAVRLRRPHLRLLFGAPPTVEDELLEQAEREIRRHHEQKD